MPRIKQDLQRLTINLPRNDYSALQKLADSQNITITACVLRALTVYGALADRSNGRLSTVTLNNEELTFVW